MEYPMKKLIPSNFFYERYPNVLVFQLGNTVRVGFKFYKDTQDSLVIFTFDAALKDIIMTVPEGMELSLGAMLDMANEAERQIKCGNVSSMCLELLSTFFMQIRYYRNGKMEEGIDHSIVGILSEMINSENDAGYAVTQYQRLKQQCETELERLRFGRKKSGWTMNLDGNIHATHPTLARNPYARPEGMAEAYATVGTQLRGTHVGIDRPTTMVADDGALRIRATAPLEEQGFAIPDPGPTRMQIDPDLRAALVAEMMEDLVPTRLITNPNEIGDDWDELINEDDNLPIEELPVENLPVQELPISNEPFNVNMPHDDLAPQRGEDEEMF